MSNIQIRDLHTSTPPRKPRPLLLSSLTSNIIGYLLFSSDHKNVRFVCCGLGGEAGELEDLL